MKWTKSRIKELEAFRTLLREVSSMNSGSNIVGRILECEKIAKKLGQSNLNTGRASFEQFLTGLAIDERSPAAGEPSSKEKS